MYQYLMVPFQHTFIGDDLEQISKNVATSLQEFVNNYSSLGWEFDQMNTFTTISQPGCLASLLGAKSGTATIYIITFRRSDLMPA